MKTAFPSSNQFKLLLTLLFAAVFLPAVGTRAEELTILSAKWGGGSKWVDVTDSVRELLSDRRKDYSVGNGTFKKGDPTPGWKKQAKISYVFGDKKQAITYHEGAKFSYDRLLSHALGIPYKPGSKATEELRRAIAAESTPPSAQVFTKEQMSGIVLIEGDKGVGSGFLADIKGKKWVVTNLHVLGENERFTIKTLTGEDVRVSVKKVIGAVGADIALLGLSDGQDHLVTIPLSKNVLETSEIGRKVVVVGNRLGGGVATQSVGHIRGIGPSRLEIDARFQPGNSGSPIYDIDDGTIVGVASYTQSIRSADIAGSPLDRLLTGMKTRWFGYRIDTVEKWQTIEWSRWRKQVTGVGDHHRISMAALAVLRGDLLAAREDDEIWNLVLSFREDGGKFGKNAKTRDLILALQAHISARKNALNGLKFYDYFLNCPYWESNVPQQKKFRERLIESCAELAREME